MIYRLRWFAVVSSFTLLLLLRFGDVSQTANILSASITMPGDASPVFAPSKIDTILTIPSFGPVWMLCITDVVGPGPETTVVGVLYFSNTTAGDVQLINSANVRSQVVARADSGYITQSNEFSGDSRSLTTAQVVSHPRAVFATIFATVIGDPISRECQGYVMVIRQ
jgi:hypothetical protein